MRELQQLRRERACAGIRILMKLAMERAVGVWYDCQQEQNSRVSAHNPEVLRCRDLGG